MKLSKKALMFSGLLILTAAVVVSAILFFNLKNVAHERNLAEITFINESKQAILMQKMEALKNNAISLKETPPVLPLLRALSRSDRRDPITTDSLQTLKGRLEQNFSALLKGYSHYDQIRLISTIDEGQELVRVDRIDNEIVIAKDLQNKKDRPYYEKALKLKSNEVYLSPIELNQEYGAIEVPYKPVIRAIVPLYLEDRMRGLIVINKNMSHFLNELEKSFLPSASSFVFDHRKNMVAHPDPHRRFALDLNPSDSNNLADPPVWQSALDLAKSSRTVIAKSLSQKDFLSHLILYKYNPLDDRDFLAFVTQVPVDVVIQSPNSVMIRASSAILLLLILLMPFGFVFAKQFTAPLFHLAESIRHYRKTGQLVERKIQYPFFEMEELSKAFHDLTTTIETQRQELISHQQKLAAQEKFAALGVLSGGIAHEINNPLAIINSYTDSLKIMIKTNDVGKERLEKLAERLEAAVLRIRDIVDGLRTFSRGEDNSTFNETSLTEVMKVSCRYISAGNTKGIDFQVSFPETDLIVYAKAGPLSQVFVNLLHNALFAASDSPHPWVKMDTQEDPLFAYVRVLDSGKLPADLIDKIMDPFFTTKPEGQGTGLGLSISKNIVERHNGFLYIDQTCENTCFVVKIPKA